MIRKAEDEDLSRIAEILVFNNRINYLPIFMDEDYSFGKLQVLSVINEYREDRDAFENLYVYDDGLVRGFLQMNGTEIQKLYADPFFQSRGIGKRLIEFATSQFHADHLWVVEKNRRAISFYQRHGFKKSEKRKLEDGTTEFIVLMER